MPPARRASPGTRQHNGSMSAFARSRAGLSRPASAARSSPEHAARALTGLVEGEAVDPRDAVAADDRVPPPLARCRVAQRHVPKQAQRDAIDRPKCAAADRARQPSNSISLYALSQVPQQLPGQRPTCSSQPNSKRSCKGLRRPCARRALAAGCAPRFLRGRLRKARVPRFLRRGAASESPLLGSSWFGSRSSRPSLVARHGHGRWPERTHQPCRAP